MIWTFFFCKLYTLTIRTNCVANISLLQVIAQAPAVISAKTIYPAQQLSYAQPLAYSQPLAYNQPILAKSAAYIH